MAPTRAYLPEPTDEAIAHAAQLLAGADRPLVLAGNGVVRRRATAELRAFAKGLHVPVAVTFMGKGAIPVVTRHVTAGSTVITDGHDGYRGLVRAGYNWSRVPHPRGGMVRGGANRATPAADGATSRFKRWLTGTYNKPPADLTRYLGEFCCFRAEFRNDPGAAFATLLGLAIANPTPR